MANLVMATSTTNLLKLKDVVVYKNLGHPLNLGLNFCRQFRAKLNYEGDQLRIQIRGESYSLLNSAALERRGGPKPAGGASDQPRDQEQEKKGQTCTRSKKKGAPAPPGQMSTFLRFEGLGVKFPATIAITNMSSSVSKKVSSGTKGKGTLFGLDKQGNH